MKELQIVKELQDLIPPLTKEEYNLLEQSIIKEGVRDPIIVWGDMIVDGHNRYEICQKYNIEFKTIDITFKTMSESKIWIIENQVSRRNLTPSQKSALAVKLEKEFSIEAKERMLSGKKEEDPTVKLLQGKDLYFSEDGKKALPISEERDYHSKISGFQSIKNIDSEMREVVYFIQPVNGGDIKIGCSKDVSERLKQLQISHPDKLIVTQIIPGGYKKERELHKQFKDIKKEGEWFRATRKLSKIAHAIPKRLLTSSEQAGDIMGISGSYVTQAKKISKEKPYLLEEIIKGNLDISQAKDIIKQEVKELQKVEDKKLADIYDENEKTNHSHNMKVYHGGFQDICKTFDPESIDHIITDPPYPKEFLPLWSDLSETAERLLKPGGFCICYAGKYYLPEFINRLSEHLNFYWQCILLHTGHLAGVHPVKMNTGYKPILIFQKPPRTPQREYIKDVIIGSGREKGDYEWQQSVDELTHLIEGFTNVGDIVLDPMAGTGSVGLGCYKNKRQFVLIEENEERVNIIKRRLSSEV